MPSARPTTFPSPSAQAANRSGPECAILVTQHCHQGGAVCSVEARWIPNMDDHFRLPWFTRVCRDSLVTPRPISVSTRAQTRQRRLYRRKRRIMPLHQRLRKQFESDSERRDRISVKMEDEPAVAPQSQECRRDSPLRTKESDPPPSLPSLQSAAQPVIL
jgi:hypothetical protein